MLYAANVIANTSLKVGGRTVDVSNITPALLSDTLHEIDEVEANVATGYHAIEFLLWGQDLNGTGPGAGARPASDYSLSNCTNGHCDRRAAYLKAATELLVSDLADMAALWAEGGEARENLLNGDPQAGLITILTGMGSLSYGELAGERMKLGLMLHDPEEEHDCFSDNTHHSHYYDALGIRNVYTGEYTRVDGSKVKGASLSAYVAKKDPALDRELRARLDATMAAMRVLVDMAEGGMAYDQMIGSESPKGNQVVQNAIDGLLDQTKSIERVVAALGLQSIGFEGSDSLDNPSAVTQ
jgi:putative iron-regulated protein